MSLIEVMVAAALLGLGAAGIISSWANVTALLTHQRRLAEASAVTRSQLEGLLALPSGSSRLAPGALALGTVDLFGTPATVGYEVVANIAANTPGPGFLQITVVTTWNESGRSRQTSLITYRER